MYRITDWRKHFENNRTKELKRMDWIPIPNRMDGDGYTELLDHPNGAAHFGAWIAIVEISSRQDERGTLPQLGAGIPHDLAGMSQRLARISRIPAATFEEVIPRLIQIGWIQQLIEIPHEGAGMSQLGAVIPQDGAALSRDTRAVTEQDGTEGNGIVAKNGTSKNTRWSYNSDDSFLPFATAALTFWTDLIEEDLQKSWMFTWKALDFSQKLLATNRLNERIESGEDPYFVSRLPKYLESGDWKRPPRAAPKPKTNGRPTLNELLGEDE